MRESTLNWLRARAAEPSTWRGIAAGLMALGIAVDPEQVNAILTLGLIIISAIDVVKKDSPPK